MITQFIEANSGGVQFGEGALAAGERGNHREALTWLLLRQGSHDGRTPYYGSLRRGNAPRHVAQVRRWRTPARTSRLVVQVGTMNSSVVGSKLIQRQDLLSNVIIRVLPGTNRSTGEHRGAGSSATRYTASTDLCQALYHQNPHQSA